MDLKQKLVEAKKKIKENPTVVTNALIAVGAASTAYAFYVSKRIIDTYEDLVRAEAVIRDINENAHHVRETGHSVTYFNGKGEALFVMTNPEED